MTIKNSTHLFCRREKLIEDLLDSDFGKQKKSHDFHVIFEAANEIRSCIGVKNKDIDSEFDIFISESDGGWFWKFEYMPGLKNEGGVRDLHIPHSLAHCFVFHRIPGGKVRIQINNEVEERIIQDNELQIIPAMHSAKISMVSDGPFHIVNLLMSPLYASFLLRFSRQVYDPRLQLKSSLGKSDTVATNLMTAILDYAKRSGGEMLVPMASTLICYLLEEYGYIDDSQKLTLLSEEKINIVREIMAGQMETGLDLGAISAKLRVTENWFCRTFKNTTGQTPFQYYYTLRMIFARDLVEKTTKSLTDIAMELGFSDAPHFSKSFNKHWKILPSHLRSKLTA